MSTDRRDLPVPRSSIRALAGVTLAVLAGWSASSIVAASSSASQALTATVAAGSARTSFLAPLRKVSTIASTVPTSGDVNPYGIALVQTSVGNLKSGDLLVSNFNDKANDQGTGTTIVQISPTGERSLFATVAPGPTRIERCVCSPC